MVIRLTRPELNLGDLELIDQVVDERQNGSNRNFFMEIHPRWRKRVAQYLDFYGDPRHIKPWEELNDSRHHGKFQNLYSHPQPDSAQKPILEKLRERILDFCPACGEDGTPNTLDHYLPQSIFPEFSITSVNLFPMCDICQGKKGTRTLDDEGQRLFIHPYFDVFLDQQVVILKIFPPFATPGSIRLEPHPELEDDYQYLVFRHLQNLDIEARYYRYFRVSYPRLLRLVNRTKERGLNITAQLEQFRGAALDKSVNSWGHVFYDGVLDNSVLLEYLETEELPLM